MPWSRLVLSTLLLVLVRCGNVEYDEAAEVVSDGIDVFSRNLYQRVANSAARKNLALSGLGANVVLSMAAYGSEGSTLERLTDALGLPSNRSLALRGYSHFLAGLRDERDVVLELASRVFMPRSNTVRATFLELAKHVFLSEAGSDLSSVDAINDWVKTKTRHRIRELLRPGDLGDPEDPESSARLILVSALYFRGEWALRINANSTVGRAFHLSNGSQLEAVPTMYVVGSLISGYLEPADADFFALPYQGENFNMIFVVPRKLDGLSGVESQLSLLDVASLMNHSRHTIQVFVPKFQIQSDIDLKKPLEDMGFQDLFQNTIYSHISEEPLRVSKILQKSFVEVNERGSEAVSSTALMMNRSFSNLIRVDRPFLYLITRGSHILFIGRVMDPSQQT